MSAVALPPRPTRSRRRVSVDSSYVYLLPAGVLLAFVFVYPTIQSILPSRSARTCRAVVGLTRPERLADGAVLHPYL